MWVSLKNLLERYQKQRKMARLGQLGTRKRRTAPIWSEAADRSLVLAIFMAVLLWVVCVVVLTLPTLRERPHLVPDQLAPTTIFARTDFAYEDVPETARLREEATNNQATYLKISANRNEQIRQNFNELFKAVAERSAKARESELYVAPDLAVDKTVAAMPPLPFSILERLLLDESLRSEFALELELLLNGGIVDAESLKELPQYQSVRIVDLSQRDRLPKKREALLSLSGAASELAAHLLSYCPEDQASELDREALNTLMLELLGRSGNLELDSLRTIAKRDEAIAAVKPVMREVKKNEIIVHRNQLVDSMTLAALQAHDRSLQQQTRATDWIQKFFRNVLWSFIMVLFVGFYLYHIHPEIVRSNRKIGLLGTIVALSLLVNYGAMEFFYFLSSSFAIPPSLIADAVPLALPAVLLGVMVGFRVSIYGGFFVALISALMLSGSFDVALEGLAVSSLVALAVRNATNYRSFFLRTFFSVALSEWLLDFNMLWHLLSAPEMLKDTAFLALGNALFTAVAGLLLTFLFELIFNVSTNMSLMVLCDFNHPLLKEMHLRAPGTSNHSQNVALLAENAALEIGANPIRARAAALFHDIGKIKNPEYFIENCVDGMNAHAALTPRMSSIVIMNHVKDGVDLALQYKLCRLVVNAIREHHGTDLLYFFYHQAKQNDAQVIESDYRYPGPLPHEKEIVIVSLADACEAACRSLEKPTAVKIETMVEEIFRKRWRDGQLDAADLTVEELALIKESFVHALITMHHSRIAYPPSENAS